MIRSLIKHSIIFGLGIGLLRLLNFVLLPLYTKYLTVTEVGVLELMIVLFTFSYTVLQFGLGSGVFKYLSLNNSGKDGDKELISSSIIFITCLSLLGCLLLFFAYPIINNQFFNNSLSRISYSLVLVAIFLHIQTVIPNALLRYNQKSIIFSVLQIVRFIIELSFIIFLIVVLKMKWDAVYIGKIISSIILVIILYIHNSKYIIPFFNFKKITGLLKYSMFLMPVGLSNMFISLTNKSLIKHYLSIDEVAIFSIGYRLSTIVSIVVFAFQYAWPTFLFKIQAKKDAKKIYSNVFHLYFLIIGTLVLFVFLFSDEIILLLTNQKYLGASSIFKIISLSYLFWGMFYSGTVGLHLTNRTYILSISIVTIAILNLVLNIILIPRYGIQGCAFSILICYLILGIIAVVKSNKYYQINFYGINIIFFIILFIVSFFISNNFSFFNHMIFEKIILLLVFILINSFINFDKFTNKYNES